MNTTKELEARKREIVKLLNAEPQPNTELRVELNAEYMKLCHEIVFREETHFDEMVKQLKKCQPLIKSLAQMGHSYCVILEAENRSLLAKLEESK